MLSRETVSLALALVLFEWFATPANSTEPQADALVQGVLDSRASLRSGIIDLTITKKNTTSVTYKSKIFFKSGKFFYETFTDIFVSVVPADGNDDPSKTIESLKFDLGQASEKGAVKRTPTTSRIIIDGAKAIGYNPVQGASQSQVNNWYNYTGELLTHPKSLGLEGALDFFLPPEKCLRNFTEPGSEASVEIAGTEMAGGVNCQRVRITSPEPSANTSDFWIDGRDFSVLKVIHSAKTGESDTILSSYRPDVKPLPTQVIVTRRNSQGQVFDELNLVVTKAEFNIDVPDKTFELASLGMPHAELVRVRDPSPSADGYWDGEKIVDSFPVKQGPSSLAASPPLPQPQPRDWRGLAYAAAGAGAVLLTLAILRVARSRTRNQS